MTLLNVCHRSALVACLALLLCACSSTGRTVDKKTITVTSNPAGATVTADGMRLGTTPVEFEPSAVFRSGFTGGDNSLLVFRYQGRLGLEKPGCKEQYIEVDDRVLAQDIHVELECDPAYSAAEPATQTPADAVPDNAAQRLQRIQDLHNKGLISEEEYRTLRQRVLDTL